MFHRSFHIQLLNAAFFVIAFHGLATISHSQRIAVITPQINELGEKFVNSLGNLGSEKFKVLDRSLTNTAFFSVGYENPFNLTLNEAKNIGQATGSEFVLLIRAETIHRFSLERNEFFESYATVYLVSSRTGRLGFWKLVKAESQNSIGSENLLLQSADSLRPELAAKISDVQKSEMKEASLPKHEELPDADSPDSKNLRPPLPYKRISPKYTEIANLYGVAATVDVLVDVDENGKILRTEIDRWAGFGLDESVVQTVTEMNWRPADRNGKPIPMRVLLRYNFKKLEKQ
jgi:Gram-negative bacterial TonB protein C-terminal